MTLHARLSRLATALTLTLLASGATAQDLTGTWCDDHGTRYLFRQAGDEVCWRMDDLPRVQNVFCGSVVGRFLAGAWLDLPGGQLLGGGRLVLAIDSANELVKTYQEGDYGGSTWTRADASGACAAGPGLRGTPQPIAPPQPGGSVPPRSSAPPPPPPPGGISPPRSNAPPPPPPPPGAGAPSAPRSNPPLPQAPAPRPAVPPLPSVGGAVSLPPQPGAWRLVGLEQRGTMDDRPATPGDGGMRFDVRRFDATGGEVLATVTMASPVICPRPETETILIKWSFPSDIRYLRPGDEFAVDMTVEPFAQSRSCPTGVFGRSEAVVMRSEGSVEDIPAAERASYWPPFTHPYIRDNTGVRYNFYVGGAQNGRAVLHVHDERPPVQGPRRSSYSIRFWSNACCGTPQPAANTWSFHYFYEY